MNPITPKEGRSWPDYILGGRLRTSTAALLISFFAILWLYETYETPPPPPQVPFSEVVPPGFVPDPNYTWAPRTDFQKRSNETSVTAATTSETPTTSSSPATPSASTSPPSPTASTTPTDSSTSTPTSASPVKTSAPSSSVTPESSATTAAPEASHTTVHPSGGGASTPAPPAQ